jgi:hypothetical protein
MTHQVSAEAVTGRELILGTGNKEAVRIVPQQLKLVGSSS